MRPRITATHILEALNDYRGVGLTSTYLRLELHKRGYNHNDAGIWQNINWLQEENKVVTYTSGSRSAVLSKNILLLGWPIAALAIPRKVRTAFDTN